MNRTEAAVILRSNLDRLESLGYAPLSALIGENQTSEQGGETGARYQLELNFLWDHRANGAIRIIGSIDDGGLGAFMPLTESRLVNPPGQSSERYLQEQE